MWYTLMDYRDTIVKYYQYEGKHLDYTPRVSEALKFYDEESAEKFKIANSLHGKVCCCGV